MAAAFPLLIKSGSVTVKIYEVRRKDGRAVYSVAWHAEGGRKLRQYQELKEAKAFARVTADDLAAGQVEQTRWTAADRDDYETGRRIAGGMVTPALREWERVKALVGSDLLAACEAWAEKRRGAVKQSPKFERVVKEFMAAKEDAGVDTKAGYARTLPNAVEAMGGLRIGEILPAEIDRWLSGYKHPSSRNSHRKRLVSVFRWARKRGYLPLDVMTSAERTDTAKEAPLEIGLVTVEQLGQVAALLTEKMPGYLPVLWLAAGAGLRRKELHGQIWEDIDLDRGLLRVTAAKPNTPARRLVPLHKATVQALRACDPPKKGPICANLTVDRIRDIARTAGVHLAENGFRNTWISARVASTGNIAETSLEAGNSPATIRKHYLELMRKDQAEAWWQAPAPEKAENQG